MKNLILGVIGIVVMILSFAIPSFGGEVLQVSSSVLVIATISFFVVAFLAQSYLKANHVSQVERCESKIPKIF